MPLFKWRSSTGIVHESTHLGLCPTLVSLKWVKGLFGESPASSLRPVAVRRVRKRGFHSDVSLKQARWGKLSSTLVTYPTHGSGVRKVALSKLTKPRQDSTLENGLDDDPAPSQYCEVVTLVRDCELLPPQKWHEGCWLLPFGSQRWLKWPNVCLCEGGVEHLRLHSQRTREDPSVVRRTNQRKFST